ncbi:MAG: phospho-N-acetylmuramoyl-pentapeptide-transferase [Helicobacteraceae bacterium]|jgi:phospho-N-acetylmuramoyl-pentapeptide-transferase|nr:phospho-N-acetylmuramoyl-pentapeptide-transferase [Helicobacteraceae bacterium]
MLYFLAERLPFNLFSYITVRSGAAFCMAFALALWFFPRFIVWAKRQGATQPILSHAPAGHHRSKQNTPTMGGAVIAACALIATLLSVNLSNVFAWGGILTIALFSAIGMLDDVRKIYHKQNDKGLSARLKFVLQILAAAIVSALLLFVSNLNTLLYLPFIKEPIADFGLYMSFFWIIVFVSASNAVNITDGLDGLAAAPGIFAIATLTVFVYISGHAQMSQSLLLPSVSGAGEMAVIASAMLGALLGFLWFNANPAEVFMGDSGSLSIGAFIAYLAIISKTEALLILICFIFVVETISVILQVGSYKLRRRRMFLMAPLHHHFELMRWAENKIIVRFWIIALLSNVLALITIKIR